jgi:diacylglycerol kinase (ATP)
VLAFVVLNPKSGSCTAADVRRAIDQHLGAFEVEVHEVSEGDDLPGLVRSAIGRGLDPIVAAGGDGTVSVVADVLVGTEAHLVVLPLGTANVLARELGIPVELEGACRLGANCVRLGSLAGTDHAVFRLDAMKVGHRHYLTQIGVGIDALMIRDTADAHKKRFGRLAYLWTAATSLVGFQPRKFTITVDDRARMVKASQVVVANTGMMGQPPFRWGPDIRADDGRLNVCIVRARTLVDYLGIFWHVFRAQHRQDPNVRYLVASRSVAIAPKHPLPVQADGEIVGDTPIRVEVVPNALRVVVPTAV